MRLFDLCLSACACADAKYQYKTYKVCTPLGVFVVLAQSKDGCSWHGWFWCRRLKLGNCVWLASGRGHSILLLH